jgi:hypothetical protein
MGLEPKLALGRRKTKRKACGLVLMPKSLVLNSQVKVVDRVQEPVSGQRESSSEKMPERSAIEPVAAPLGKNSRAKSWFQQGFLRPGYSSSPEEIAVLALGPTESSSIGEILSEECLPSSGLVNFISTSLGQTSLENALLSPELA